MKTLKEFLMLVEGSGKAVLRDKNKSGKLYALVQLSSTGDYVVYSQSANYSRNSPGGLAYSWRPVDYKSKLTVVEQQKYYRDGISYELALELFKKKISGSQK